MSKIIKKYPLLTQFGVIFIMSVLGVALWASGDALLITGDGTASLPIDNAISNRISSLGFNVVLKSDSAATTNDAAGKSIIFISESSASSALTNRFRNVPIPLMTSEYNLYDDLDFTANTLNTHFGTNGGQTNLTIVGAAHFLEAGLTTLSPLASTPKLLTWGVPNTNAIVAARIFGSTNRAASFSYEINKSMFGTTSPERRTGFFMDRSATNDFSADAWRLFDASFLWTAGERPVLFVTADGASTTSPQELAIIDRLEYLGYKVFVASDSGSVAGDAGGKYCVIISGSCDQADVSTKFRDVATPVVCLQNLLFDDMAMTSTTLNTDFGSTSGQQYLDIADSSHAIACGLRGDDVQIATAGINASWGVPSTNATTIAYIQNSLTQSAVFVYEQGATMVGMAAPGRRAGFYWSPHATDGDATTAQGWALFDATVDWASRSIPALFVVSSPSSMTAGDQVVLARLRQLGFDVEVKDDAAIRSTAASGKAIVGISASVTSTAVSNIFRYTPVPVVVMERAIYDDVFLIATNDFGLTASTTNLVIENAWHPLAGRNPQGTNSISISPMTAGWGIPLSSAKSGAHEVGSGTHSVSFGYEAGAQLLGTNLAPARRVAIGFRDEDAFGSTTNINLKPSGWALFDAAYRWALGHVPGIFDEDGDDLDDNFEMQYFGDLDEGPTGDFDGDGLNNAQEFLNGTSPIDFYNGTLPLITKLSGDNQSGFTNLFLGTPFTAYVSTNSIALTNAPVLFNIASGGGLFSSVSNGTTSATLEVRTDTNGIAQSWFKLPTTPGTNLIWATITSGAGSTYETFTAVGGFTPEAPVLSPTGGIFTTQRSVRLTSGTTNAQIHYTLNGVDPVIADFSITNGGSVLVDHDATLKAKAFIHGFPSTVATGDFEIRGAIAAGGDYNFGYVLAYDGQLHGWGENNPSLPGVGSVSAAGYSYPVETLHMTNAVVISAGARHAVTVREDTTVWAWGVGSNHRLGNGATTNTQVPVKVGTLTNITTVAAGWQHSLALHQDGTLWAWGLNSSGQLGDGTTTTPSSPVQVVGLSNITAIAAGNNYSVALHSNGTVYAWGNNGFGQFGLSNTTASLTPIPTHFTNSVAVAAGASFVLTLKNDGNVWGAGLNNDVELGTNSHPNPTYPVRASITNVVAISAGFGHSLAMKSDGTVWGWGNNQQGQLGIGVLSNDVPPTQIAGITNIVAIAAGNNISMALRGYDGIVFSAGDNFNGGLAHGNFTDSSTFRRIVNVEAKNWYDADLDGMPDWQEELIGSDPFDLDSNDDGLSDSAAYQSGVSSTSADTDGDGIPNSTEVNNGTSPLSADTDGDGVNDDVDHYPTDPTRAGAPATDPGDVTAPMIRLDQP
jgi:alpha-tubulin suppressor-like RCC1 family protein